MNKDRSHVEFLCVDIEATCWNENEKPQGMVSEIVEIGYAVFDATNNVIHSNGSIFVKPTQSTISDFCTRLTGITQTQLDNGISFYEACEILKKNLNSLGRPWASMGDYDRKMFDDQCKRMSIEYPFVVQHLNVKQLSAAIQGKVRGLGSAINSLGLQFEGKQHMGKDDALNVARILQHYRTKFGEKFRV